MKTYTLGTDGALIITDDNGGVKDSHGIPCITALSIQPANIAAHRRDKDFDAALQAAAGTAKNLTADELAKLPAAK